MYRRKKIIETCSTQNIFIHLCFQAKVDDAITTTIYDKVYDNFVEEIDAIDNGISVSDEKPRFVALLRITVCFK